LQTFTRFDTIYLLDHLRGGGTSRRADFASATHIDRCVEAHHLCGG